MSIEEYAVIDDFLHVDEAACGEFDFPCCVCKFRKNDPKVGDCRFCGHNVDHDEYFCCVVCGTLVSGNPYDNGFHIAAATVSKLGPLCENCFDNIVDDSRDR